MLFTNGEHPSTPKLRVLLALAASAVKVGQPGEAAAAGKAARSLADAVGLRRGYIEVHATCALIAEHLLDTSILDAYVTPTPAAAWQYSVELARAAFDRYLDPETHVIIGVIATGALDSRGCLVLLTDWSRVYPATDLVSRALGEASA